MSNKEINILELFSGIGGFTKGFEQAGFKIKNHWFSEIDKHAIANYKYNYPNAQYVGSVKFVRDIIRIVNEHRITGEKLIITTGSPCQNFSLAGNRLGLQGQSSSLIRFAIVLIKWLKPDIYIWENVKGAYSSNDGADYWAIIQAFAKLDGYRHEQQLINGAWFLPQHRERIYHIGHLTTTGGSKSGVFPITENLRGFDKSSRETQENGQRIRNGSTRCLSGRYYKDGSEILVRHRGDKPFKEGDIVPTIRGGDKNEVRIVCRLKEN